MAVKVGMAAPINTAVRAACSLGPLVLASGLLMTVGAAPSNAQDSSITFTYLGPATTPDRAGEVKFTKFGSSDINSRGTVNYGPFGGTSTGPDVSLMGDFFKGIGGIEGVSPT